VPARACWFESSQGHQAEGGPHRALFFYLELRQDWARPSMRQGSRCQGKRRTAIRHRSEGVLISRRPSTSPGDTSLNRSASLRLWTSPSWPTPSPISATRTRRRSSLGRDGRLGAGGDPTRRVKEVACRVENVTDTTTPFLPRSPAASLISSSRHTESTPGRTPWLASAADMCSPKCTPFTSPKLPSMTDPRHSLLSAGICANIRHRRSKGE
jgi:hypothetical protein